MCVKAFDDDTVSDTETLSLTYLPDRVHWPTRTADPAKPNQWLILHWSLNFAELSLSLAKIFCLAVLLE